MNHTLAHQAAFHPHSIGAPLSNPPLKRCPELTSEPQVRGVPKGLSGSHHDGGRLRLDGVDSAVELAGQAQPYVHQPRLVHHRRVRNAPVGVNSRIAPMQLRLYAQEKEGVVRVSSPSSVTVPKGQLSSFLSKRLRSPPRRHTQHLIIVTACTLNAPARGSPRTRGAACARTHPRRRRGWYLGRVRVRPRLGLRLRLGLALRLRVRLPYG